MDAANQISSGCAQIVTGHFSQAKLHIKPHTNAGRKKALKNLQQNVNIS
jgi:hypothetical protein